MKLVLIFFTLFSVYISCTYAQIKAIYGHDDRRSIVESATIYQQQARSIAVMVSDFYLLDNYMGEYELFSPVDLQEKKGVCSDVKFARDYAIGSCTGFLIAPNKLMTARHCIEQEDCSSAYWVFGMTSDKDSYAKKDVYRCNKIQEVKHYKPWEKRPDVVIVELERAVEGRTPFSIFAQSSVTKSDKLYSISSPSGLSLKLSHNGKIKRVSKRYVRASLDLFKGSSGAPVFIEHTHQLIGIVVQGEQDFYYNRYRRCFELKKSTSRGEKVLLLNRLF
jgi:hypothetical protein